MDPHPVGEARSAGPLPSFDGTRTDGAVVDAACTSPCEAAPDDAPRAGAPDVLGALGVRASSGDGPGSAVALPVLEAAADGAQGAEGAEGAEGA